MYNLFKLALRIRWKLITTYRKHFPAKLLDKLEILNSSSFELENNEFSIFFGYHDKTPFSDDNQKLLACRVAASDKDPMSECTEMEIGYYEIAEKSNSLFKVLGITNTWCWQQGCMLQWFPLSHNKEVIFNKLIGSQYGSCIVDVATGNLVKEFSLPIYSLSQSGEYAVSLNFSRIGRLRPGYGYRLLPDKFLNDNIPKDDGLLLINIKTGAYKLVVSLFELANRVPESTQYEHYINHAIFSPDGQNISFFHIYQQDKQNKRMLFYLYNIKDNKLNLLEDERIISHYCWKNNNEILATTLKPYFHWQYRLFNTKNSSSKKVPINLIFDGHPMYSPKDEHLIVTDSYPDKNNFSYLFSFNFTTNKTKLISSYSIPTEYKGQVRCDLHPRWNPEGTMLCADIVKNNRRSMAIISFLQQ